MTTDLNFGFDLAQLRLFESNSSEFRTRRDTTHKYGKNTNNSKRFERSIQTALPCPCTIHGLIQRSNSGFCLYRKPFSSIQTHDDDTYTTTTHTHDEHTYTHTHTGYVERVYFVRIARRCLLTHTKHTYKPAFLLVFLNLNCSERTNIVDCCAVCCSLQCIWMALCCVIQCTCGSRHLLY